MPYKESKEEIARRLHITRLALGFETQAGFAEALDGVTAQGWNNYESGRDRLTLNLALSICRKFPQITLDWLFRGDKSTLRPAFSAAFDYEEEKVAKHLGRQVAGNSVTALHRSNNRKHARHR